MASVNGSTLIAAFIVCSAVTTAAVADCKLLQIAELPVSVAHNRPLIDAKINDQPVKILVDTGASYSFLWEDEAKHLGLPLRQIAGLKMYGVDGEAQALAARVNHLQIGAFTFKDMDLTVIGTNRDPRTKGWDPSALVLGEDFFSKFTTEFDFAHGVIRLLKPEGCQPEQLAYWGKTYSLAELERTNEGVPSIKANVLVNGQHVMAVLDTGAVTSHISQAAARRAGFTPDPSAGAVSKSTGLAGRALEVWTGTFASFAIGDEVVRNVRLRIADLFGRDKVQDTGSNLERPIDDLPSMLIGCDFFISHHVMVLFKEHKLLFTYNGGPIFQTIEPDAPPAVTASAEDNPTQAADNH
jgi:clan AA aspartic protease (TIGR02281 family)